MKDFDVVLLSRVRLGVVSVLVTRGAATFSDLRTLLGLTQGNLGIHLTKLEEPGYVHIEKAFVDRKPQTTVRLTPKGRKAFLAHVEALERIAKQARSASPGAMRASSTPPPTDGDTRRRPRR